MRGDVSVALDFLKGNLKSVMHGETKREKDKKAVKKWTVRSTERKTGFDIKA